MELTNPLFNSLDERIKSNFEIYDLDSAVSYYMRSMNGFVDYEYDDSTSKYSAKVFVYLKKGRTYRFTSYSYSSERYDIIVDEIKYNFKSMEYKYTGQKSIALEFEKI